MFKRIIYIILTALAITNLAACNKESDLPEIHESNTYDQEIFEAESDTILYKGVIQDILNAHGDYKETVDLCIYNHGDLMTEDLKNKLLESVINVDNQIDMEDMTISDEEESLDSTEDELGWLDIEMEDMEIEDESEIVEDFMTDIDAEAESNTLLDEAEEYNTANDLDLESTLGNYEPIDWDVYTGPTYVVAAVDMYKDKAIASVSILGKTPCKVVFNLVDSKLGLYSFYYT